LKTPSHKVAKQKPSKAPGSLGAKAASGEPREIAALERFKELMKSARKLLFAGHGT
jgi:hypothetical protein